MKVLRWGQSAYETDADMAREGHDAASLGLDWSHRPVLTPPPSLEGVDALVVTSKVAVDAALLERFPGSLVLTTTSGTDHIDIEAARSHSVQVARCPLARRDPVVEHALGAMLGLGRRLPSLLSRAAEGDWARGELPRLAARGLAGSRVGLIGFGVIGRRMAEVLATMGATPVPYDPAVQDATATLAEVLACPFVSVHCSLTSASRGLLDDRAISRLRDDAVLVNTARGQVVDVVAAMEAVRTKKLRGFAADVFPVEPYPSMDAGVDGVWLTPHSSGYVDDLGARVAQEVRESLRLWRDGAELPHTR